MPASSNIVTCGLSNTAGSLASIENTAGRLVGIEVKAAANVKESDLRGLKKLAGVAGVRFKMGVLLYDGLQTLPLGDGLWAVPLSTLPGNEY